jgi:hydrogenase maturation protease
VAGRDEGVLVVGFGSSLMGDDAAGLAVAACLSGSPLPAGVRVEIAGSDSLRLPDLWRGEGHVWLVDALIRGCAAGTVHRLAHDEVLQVPQRHATVHQLSLPESLRWIALSYPEMASVRYRLWGIEPGGLVLAQELTEAVLGAVQRVAEEITREAQACASRWSSDA